MSNGAAKMAAVVGLASSGVLALLAVGLYVTTALEQVQTPGEKSLGVAALFILFAFPMTVCAGIAVISFLISAVAAVYGRLRRSRVIPMGSE